MRAAPVSRVPLASTAVASRAEPLMRVIMRL
jgi:hypothetical protein